MQNSYLFWILMAAFLGQRAVATDLDPCSLPDPSDRRLSLTLKSTSIGEGETFVGIFELENRSVSPAVVLPGIRKGTVFNASQPEITVEFKDLTSNWVPLPTLPGSYGSKPDQLSIRPNTRATFTTYLMSRQIANLSGSDFRLLVRLFNPAFCIVSSPFRAIPIRKQVEGFQSSPSTTDKK